MNYFRLHRVTQDSNVNFNFNPQKNYLELNEAIDNHNNTGRKKCLMNCHNFHSLANNRLHKASKVALTLSSIRVCCERTFSKPKNSEKKNKVKKKTMGQNTSYIRVY